jgi:hypothetical protein
MVDWHSEMVSHVVVDGSNIATEGRSVPSLRQLDEAVRQFQDEFPDVEPIVVVDATFGHRIEATERSQFDEAVANGELVSPPAGSIGRGDAFVLRIAERVRGQVLSNDSFQEFHAEHPWLFDEGRLIGGKPVPGVGWIFTLRTPVRGPRSRAVTSRRRGAAAAPPAEAAGPSAPTRAPRSRRRPAAVLEALEVAAAEATEAATHGAEIPVTPSATKGPGSSGRRRRRRRRRDGDPEVAAAIEAATEEAVAASDSRNGRSGAGRRRPKEEAAGPAAVNPPLAFLTFIAEHPLGAEVAGIVATFVSHGAMVDVGDMHCYVPLSGLGDPPPKSARAVLQKGETRRFVVVALDPPRRGVQLALPDLGGEATGSEATRAAAAARTTPGSKKAAASAASAAGKKAAAPKKAAPKKSAEAATPKQAAATKAATSKKAAASKAAAPKKAAASKAAAPKKAAASKAAASKAAASKAAASKAAASKAAAPKKAVASKAAARKAAAAKRSVASKEAPPKQVTGRQKAATPEKRGSKKTAAAAGAPKKSASPTKAAGVAESRRGGARSRGERSS